MKLFVPIFAIVMLGGCASASYTKTADGRANVDCSGMLRDWRSCEMQAARLCPSGGYNIISTATEKAPVRSGLVERFNEMTDYKTPRSMVVACKSGRIE